MTPPTSQTKNRGTQQAHTEQGTKNRIWRLLSADLDEGDAGIPEALEDGGLGFVGGRGVADEDGGPVALAGAGGDDGAANVARAADHQHPAPVVVLLRHLQQGMLLQKLWRLTTTGCGLKKRKGKRCVEFKGLSLSFERRHGCTKLGLLSFFLRRLNDIYFLMGLDDIFLIIKFVYIANQVCRAVDLMIC